MATGTLARPISLEIFGGRSQLDLPRPLPIISIEEAVLSLTVVVVVGGGWWVVLWVMVVGAREEWRQCAYSLTEGERRQAHTVSIILLLSY